MLVMCLWPCEVGAEGQAAALICRVITEGQPTMDNEMLDRKCVRLDLIPVALAKTGFILENLVSEEFKKAGWSTIGSKYYADDIDGRARELDLVAYRVITSDDVDVRIAVLVSCKKDAATTWAFLTKERPKHDPNFDWDPVHYWTDVQPLGTYLSSTKWKDSYNTNVRDSSGDNFSAKQDVFAFQQVAEKIEDVRKEKKGGKSRDSQVEKTAAVVEAVPRDDVAIFNSISTLMKALDHELEQLPKRAGKSKRLYIFNLLAVVDAPMVEVRYEGEKGTPTEIDQINHLARYMVRRHDRVALIHFVRSDKLPAYIKHLTSMAVSGGRHMASLVKDSYDSIKSNSKIQEYFSEVIKIEMVWYVEKSLKKGPFSPDPVTYVSLGYVNNELVVGVDVFEDDQIDFLNKDDDLRRAAAALLKRRVRYVGDFKFDIDVPF